MIAFVLMAAPGAAQDVGSGQTRTDHEPPPQLPPAIQQAGIVLTVGSDVDCDFDNLQAAIDSASDGDRLQLLNETFAGTFSINSKSISVVGGYPDCNPGSSPGSRSTLNGDGESGPVLDVFYPAMVANPVRQVVIENLVIQNGGGTGFFSGGVIVQGLPGRLETLFRNVQISDNERTGVADNGAGLRVVTTGDAVSGGTFGGALAALDNNATVVRNSAGGNGGGIYCSSTHDVETEGVTTLRLGTTLVFDNQAENGGGIAVDGCRNVFLYSGGPIVLFFPTGGILGNSANVLGGGLFLDNGAEVIMNATEFLGFGDGRESALLASNTATFGGGADVRGGSRLRLEDTYVTGNTGTLFNGGIGVSGESELSIGRNESSGECPDPVVGGGVLSRPPCSVIEDNQSQNVGGVGATTGALVDISRTIFRGNEATAADGVSALRATGVATFRTTNVRAEGLLVHDNIGDLVMKVDGQTSMELLYSTVTDNSGDIALVSSPAGVRAVFDVRSSILRAADGAAMLTASGDGEQDLTAGCVITNRFIVESGFNSATSYSQVDDPLFRDAANDDFRPGFRSPAIDYCLNANGTQFDGLDGGTRGTPWSGPQPDPSRASVKGYYDLGAYERPWEAQPADLAVEASMPDTLLDAGQSVLLHLLVTNNGPETAFGEIAVIGDFNPAQLVNQRWVCLPPAGSSCTPESGNGDVNTVVGDLAPGQWAFFEILADLADPNADLEFLHRTTASESVFNLDANADNNELVLEFTAGLFADGFE